MKRIPLIIVILLSVGFLVGCDDKEKYSTDADSFTSDASGTGQYRTGTSRMGSASTMDGYGSGGGASFQPSNFGVSSKKAPTKDDDDDFFSGWFDWL